MIPVHRPELGAAEMAYVDEAMRSGEISGTSGKFIAKFEEMFAEFCGVPHAIAVSSGSTALHLAAAALDIGPGDEVLVSAATNIATANAVAQRGAIVVPIDVDPDTWCMDPWRLDEAITSKTTTVMPVHLYGHPADMQSILSIAHRHNLRVIEDCAEAHGALCHGRQVGSLGEFGCFSFYANKIITTGEGGMLTTFDEALANRARSLRNLAFGLPRFMHQEVGYNYRLTNLQAAIGVGQMERVERILAKKRQIAQGYLERLAWVPGLRLPVETSWARNVYWMFALVVEEGFGRTRNELMEDLSWAGIESRTMFCPMNLQPALEECMRKTECPVAEDLWYNGLYLPSGCGLTESDLDQVCGVVGRVSVRS